MARLLTTVAVGAVADTISNCGSASDHFAISAISTDADVHGGPRKGKPFTITVEGALDEAHQHGRVVGDLQLKALGVVNEPVTFDQKYDFLPGLAHGSTKLQIGPFTFPRAVPGVVNFIGKITIDNENAEAVTCLDLNLVIPKILAEDEETQLASERTNCGDQTDDHITNIQAETVDGVTTTTMDLDEDVDFVNLKVDLSVKAPIVPAVSFQLSHVPISVTPAIPAGQLKFVGYPSDSSMEPNDIVDVTGSLILENKNGEELRCIGFGADSSAITV